MTKRINLISGPRNISTALMYSFANRRDTEVIDEPMYAYYLNHTGITYHPMTEEILSALPHSMEEVKRDCIFNPVESDIYFIKGMAHHYEDVMLDFLADLTNVFLIRDPYQLIASFAQVIDDPTMKDIGLKREWEICKYLIDQGIEPIVIDSNDTLSDPKKMLTRLCSRIGITFDDDMLSWSAGPIEQDGVWAAHWYKNVWASTGFQKQKTSTRVLPSKLEDLYQDSVGYYKLLSKYK